MNDLAASIGTIPDYPKPGILFRDITTLLGDARAFRRAVDELVQPWAGMKIDKVAGIEARGFILGGAVAHQVSAGFIPIRKKGKLPHKRVSIAYSLEYGLDEMEMHEDAVVSGERVIVIDDLIATGGTAEGAVKLLRQMGAVVLAACFIIDLPDLGGAAKLRALDVPVRTLLTFEVSDSSTPTAETATVSLYLLMNPAPLAITTTSLPADETTAAPTSCASSMCRCARC